MPTAGRADQLDQRAVFIEYFRAPESHLSGISIRFWTYRTVMVHRLILRLDVLDDGGDLDRVLVPNQAPPKGVKALSI